MSTKIHYLISFFIMQPATNKHNVLDATVLYASADSATAMGSSL